MVLQFNWKSRIRGESQETHKNTTIDDQFTSATITFPLDNGQRNKSNHKTGRTDRRFRRKKLNSASVHISSSYLFYYYDHDSEEILLRLIIFIWQCKTLKRASKMPRLIHSNRNYYHHRKIMTGGVVSTFHSPPTTLTTPPP